MRNFGKSYNFAEISNNFKAFKPEKSFVNLNLTINDLVEMQHKITMIIFRITNLNFNKIYEFCTKSKQT